MAVNWTEFLKREIENAYSTTTKLIDKVDGDNLQWKPWSGSNWMTVGQLLRHLSDACGAGMRGLVTNDWGLPPGKNIEDIGPDEMFPPAERLPTVSSVEEAKSLLHRDKVLALKTIADTGEQDLSAKEVTAPWSQGTRLPLGHQLFQMVRHLEMHKSQLFYYLKLQGVAVNTLDLWN
jgi:hypothetical protein